MFEFIKGKVDYICPEYVSIDNDGVGYQVAMPNPFVFSSKLGETVKVYTYQHVRQDIIALYGFESRDERQLFLNLISVSGIGPKGALAILATGEPELVVQAIENEDEAFLMKFPGVGKKTSRQIILDLKGKLEKALPTYFSTTVKREDQAGQGQVDSSQLAEALLALSALGYSDREINKVKPLLKSEQLTTDEYIKLALQKMLGR